MRLFILGIYLLLSHQAFCQVDPIDKTGLAIGGYDLISYFKENTARKGDPGIAAQYEGATYYFSNANHKTAFLENPQKYLPQYDGYCALAIGTTAKKISIDPETFKVTDGKLYLFFNGRSFSGTQFNSLTPWLKDEPQLISRADKNWPMVKKKKYK